MIIAFMIGYIPHIVQLNPLTAYIGDDSLDYVKILEKMQGTKNLEHLIIDAFILQTNGDRPISLLLIYMLNSLLGAVQPIVVIEYLPLLLGPILVLVTYILTRELTDNDLSSIFAAFLTAISFQVLIGIYGGFYANWIALIVGYICLTFLIRYLKRNGKVNLGVFIGSILLLLFTHAATWTIFTIVISLFSVLSLKLIPGNRRRLLIVLILTSSVVVFDYIKTFIIGTSGILVDLKFAEYQSAGLNQIANISSNIYETTQIFLGGLFGNFIILSLTGYWIYRSSIYRIPNLVLLIFVGIFIFPLLFGDVHIQSRVLYEIPFQIPSAIALTSLYSRHNRVLVISIVAWLLVISLRTVSNFYFTDQI